MNRSRPTHHKQLQLEQQRKAALICVSVMLHQRLFGSLYLFFCVCCKLLPNVFHTNDMFALSEKSAEKKTKTGRLPIAHYKQKPAGSDLWPVNRCIPTSNQSQICFLWSETIPTPLADLNRKRTQCRTQDMHNQIKCKQDPGHA